LVAKARWAWEHQSNMLRQLFSTAGPYLAIVVVATPVFLVFRMPVSWMFSPTIELWFLACVLAVTVVGYLITAAGYLIVERGLPSREAGHRFARWFAVLFVVCAIAGAMGWRWRAFDAADDRREMTLVAEAIIGYRDTNGKYPERIEDLEVAKSEHIRRTLQRTSGLYRLDTDGSPFLFYCAWDDNYFFDFKSRRWQSAD
jgi:hypothetical protein